jgi:cell division septum initiation protein DivIVA
MKQLDRRNKGLKDQLHRLQQKVARKKMAASSKQYTIQQLHQLQKLQQHHPLKLQQRPQIYSYNSISIPANTPTASATTSPTLTASNVNNIHSSHIPALIMPASEDYMFPPATTSLRDHIMNSRKCTSS